MTRDEARRFLESAGVPDAAGDARRLWDAALAGAGEKDRDNPGPAALDRFGGFVERRARREPVSHIVGGRHFWKGWFHVTPDVLDPRPDTETLVEAALAEPFCRVLDLGTGSGCILISLLAERPEATGVGTDISDKAVLVAGKNAALHGVADRIVLPISDWFADTGGRFDLIVSNPPYIGAAEMAGLEPEVRNHEPRLALTDEADGLGAYRRIAAGAINHLTPGGRLMVEIGPTQAGDVAELFREVGLAAIEVLKDLDGRDRVVSGRAPTS